MNETCLEHLTAEAISNRVADIPMLPVVVSRLLTVVGREGHSTKEVVDLVENDVVLTARVLKIANSAAFSRGQSITTLSRAILQLGERMVVGMAMGCCSPQIFNRPLEGYESAAGELWDHSLCTAIATREIIRYARDPLSADLAFTAGLLHDIGKAVISEFLKGNTEKLLLWCDSRRVEDFLTAEREVVGTDHAEVGYAIAQRWNLPELLAGVIQHHHHPSQADGSQKCLIYAVHLADMIAMMGGTGTGADTLAYTIDPDYADFLKLGKDDFDRVFLQVQEEFQNKKAAIFAGAEA